MEVKRVLAMMALAAKHGAHLAPGFTTIRNMGKPEPASVPSSRNGGRRLGNRHVQRMARKARNVRRHRAASRV